MQERFDYVTSLLHLLFPLVSTIDPHIGQFLRRSQVQPYAALPWVMTWFSHVLEDDLFIERLFDLFLATPSLMPLYLAASLIVFMSQEGLYSCPCEFTEVHNFISKFCSRTNIPWEPLIQDALKYYTMFPPHTLQLHNFLPLDSYMLRYPYQWVPRSEILYRSPTRFHQTVAVGAAIVALSAIIIGAATYLPGIQPPPSLFPQ